MRPRRARAMSTTIHSSIEARILEAQSEASKVINTPAKRLRGFEKQLERKEDNGLYFVSRIRVLAYGNLRTLIMNEAHTTKYSVHPGADKMYYDLRDLYWWPIMKKDISMLYIKEIVAGHGVAVSIISDGDRNWDTHLPLVEFPYNNGYHPSVKRAPFEALYGRRCRLGK
ncbi:putative reverse transcriptase domain-containing protein, partial [Tanacetum coccineum]